MGSFPAACCVNYPGFVLQLNKIPRSHEVGGEPKRDSLLRGSLFVIGLILIGLSAFLAIAFYKHQVSVVPTVIDTQSRKFDAILQLAALTEQAANTKPLARKPNEKEAVKTASILVEDYIVGCDIKLKRPTDQQTQAIESFLMSLGTSLEPDNQLAYALYAKWPEAKVMFGRHVIEFFKDVSKTDMGVAHLCLQLGKDMEKRSKVQLNKAFGLAMQTAVYEVEKNTKQAAKAKAKVDTLYSSMGGDNYTKSAMLSIFDEKLFNSWLSDSIAYGESRAAQLLIKEAILLSKNEFYNPCQSTSEPQNSND